MSAPAFDDTDIVPPSFSGLLPRARLVEQWCAQSRKLCLIQAPPGYGKTVLLSQIHQQAPTLSLWVSLRQADNDPVRLLHKLSAGLRRLPHVANVRIPEYLDGFAPPSMTPWIYSLIDSLNACEVRRLCLNDADLLTDPGALEVLDLLIRHTAPDFQIVVTTTAAPTFSYAHLLLEQQVSVIDQRALRFSHSDIRALFALQQKPLPSDALLEHLDTLSEGWPTAIRFAAQQCTDNDSLQNFVNEVTHGQMAFERYFVERVYEQQTPSLRRLLLRLSLTEDFNAELCRLLSDQTASDAAIPEIIRQQWFVTPVDREGRWFRFHQLFSVFLRKRAQWELSDTDIAAVRMTAARGLHAAGRLEQAIELALQANALPSAAEWMEEILPTTVIRQGRHQTYLQWFRHLPEAIIRHQPRVRLGCIVALSMGRHYLAAAEQIALLNNDRPQYDEATRRELGRTLELIYCCTMALQDDALKVEPDITRWLAQWNDIAHYQNSNDYHYELGFAWLVKGFCAKCASQFQVANDALIRAHDHFEAYGSPWGQSWVRSMIAVNYARQGFHYEAMREAIDAHAFAQQQLGEKSHPGSGLAVLIAAIYYETDEVALAEHFQGDALDYLKEQSATDLLIAGFETRARLLMHAGKREEGFGFLKDGIQWAERQSLTRLKLRQVDELIVWLLRCGRSADAERYASHHDLLLRGADDFDMHTAWHHTTARSRVYLLLSRKQYDHAFTLLEKLQSRSQGLRHQRRSAEWYKLTAMVHEKCNRHDAAIKALEKALQIASLQNYYRLFIDDQQALRRSLEQVGKAYPGASWSAFHATLMRKIQPPAERSLATETLTSREIEILRSLANGQGNKDVAAALFVSEGTLKWHLHNIYSKLGVKNRTQALLAARNAGYLAAGN